MRHQLSWQQVTPNHVDLCTAKSHALKALLAAASKPLQKVTASQLPAQELPPAAQHAKAADTRASQAEYYAQPLDPIGPSMPAPALAAVNGEETVLEAGPQLPNADGAEDQPAPGKTCQAYFAQLAPIVKDGVYAKSSFTGMFFFDEQILVSFLFVWLSFWILKIV